MTSSARLRARRAAPPARYLPPSAPRAPRAGFVLYVSLPEDDSHDAPARPSATQIAETADLLRELAQEALPGSETIAALSLAPGTTGDVRSMGERITHLRLLAPVDDDATGRGPDVLSGSGDAG